MGHHGRPAFPDKQRIKQMTISLSPLITYRSPDPVGESPDLGARSWYVSVQNTGDASAGTAEFIINTNPSTITRTAYVSVSEIRVSCSSDPGDVRAFLRYNSEQQWKEAPNGGIRYINGAVPTDAAGTFIANLVTPDDPFYAGETIPGTAPDLFVIFENNVNTATYTIHVSGVTSPNPFKPELFT